jgi:hypothetical protein
MEAGSPVSRVEPPRAAPKAGVPLVSGGWIPLAFIAVGLTAFASAAAWMAAEPGVVLLPYLHPRFIALVHLWLPGFLLSVAFGSLYQLMPVVLGTPLRLGRRAPWCHAALHSAGALALVGGFAAGEFVWVALGGISVSAGVGILLTAVLRTFLDSTRRDAPAWSLPLAAMWLSATVFLGVALALNRRWPLLPLGAVELLRAHAHLGLAGFFLTLLQGITFQLVPMFTMGEPRHPRLIWTGLLLAQGGLLVLAPGLAWSLRTAVVAGALLLVAGMASSGAALFATWQTRCRRVLEPALRAFAAGAVAMGAAGVAGLAMLFFVPVRLPSSNGFVAYGLAVVVGGLSFTVLGMLCKIVPFLVWMVVYGPRVGRQPVPLATALASPVLQQVWLWLHGAAVGLLVMAAFLGSTALASVDAWALLAGAGIFLVNVSRVMAHVFHPTRAQ